MTSLERKQWSKRYGTQRTVSFWGHDYRVTPVLVPVMFGDGKKPIWLQPLAGRPNYYVVAGHSSWDMDNGGADPFCDHLEEVYGEIESEWANSDDERWDVETKRQWEKRTSWPALNTSCGVCWGDYREN